MTERERETLDSPEKERNLRPIVVTSVTLGKEPHAGHMFLLATADLVRRGLGSEDPVILINNNTGPRAAGVVAALSRAVGIGIEEAAKLLDGGFIDKDKLVTLYRSRDENSSEIALRLLDEGRYDIFSSMAQATQSALRGLGLPVNVVPESASLWAGQQIIDGINPDWAGSGFVFSARNGVKVIQKGGQLTATGKTLVSLGSLVKPVSERGRVPLVVFVDSETDSANATEALSEILDQGSALQIPGAGVSFNGKTASGTGGEALVMEELVRQFRGKHPDLNLFAALRHLVLTMPALRNRGSPYASYDFKGNHGLVNALIEAYKESQRFIKEVKGVKDRLRNKIGSETLVGNEKAANWLSFLPLRTQSILGVKADQVLSYMRNRYPIKGREYANGDVELVLRGNYFMNVLRSIMTSEGVIRSLKNDDFDMLEATINFCMRRLGYAE